MTRIIAFLRAINVGGHTVKMDALRGLFEDLGLLRVETFIASGNVIFEVSSYDELTLTSSIQEKLYSSLGYQVATFLRTDREVAAIAAYEPFPSSQLNPEGALNVAFLTSKPDEAAIQKLMSIKTDIDDFHIHEREIYWLCKKKQSESTISNAVFEKTTGQQSTLRRIATVQKLAQKFPPSR